MLPTNLGFLGVIRRAERQDDSILQKTFVDVGSLLKTMTSRDHQVMFGRRGTGKTHLLSVLKQARRSKRETVVLIDMRTVGSSGGIYSDPQIPLPQRATRLLIDTLSAIHNEVRNEALGSNPIVDLGVSGDALNEFLSVHSEVSVQGTTTVEQNEFSDQSNQREAGANLKLSPKDISLNVNSKDVHSNKETVSEKRTVTGQATYRVNFGQIGRSIASLVDTLPNKKLWILIDEWSEVPQDIQPYLADLIRRALLPVRDGLHNAESTMSLRTADSSCATRSSIPQQHSRLGAHGDRSSHSSRLFGSSCRVHLSLRREQSPARHPQVR